MEREKIHEKLEEKVFEDIEKIVKKAELAPADYKALTEAYCLLEKMENYQNGEEGDEYSEAYHHRGSYRRGRSPRTGRYVSMSDGYSGHSINDRIVSTLEHMMDKSGSDYERDVISRWIDKVENDRV